MQQNPVGHSGAFASRITIGGYLVLQLVAKTVSSEIPAHRLLTELLTPFSSEVRRIYRSALEVGTSFCCLDGTSNFIPVLV